MLSGDEITGLTAGTARPREVSFFNWLEVAFFNSLQDNASSLGRTYSNELWRHFRGGH